MSYQDKIKQTIEEGQELIKVTSDPALVANLINNLISLVDNINYTLLTGEYYIADNYLSELNDVKSSLADANEKMQMANIYPSVELDVEPSYETKQAIVNYLFISSELLNSLFIFYKEFKEKTIFSAEDYFWENKIQYFTDFNDRAWDFYEFRIYKILIQFHYIYVFLDHFSNINEFHKRNFREIRRLFSDSAIENLAPSVLPVLAKANYLYFKSLHHDLQVKNSVNNSLLETRYDPEARDGVQIGFPKMLEKLRHFTHDDSYDSSILSAESDIARRVLLSRDYDKLDSYFLVKLFTRILRSSTSPSAELYDKLIAHFNKFSPRSHPSDKYAHEVSSLYLMNNKLSYLFRVKAYEDFKELQGQIKEDKEKHKIYNYYNELLMCKYLIKNIEEGVKNQTVAPQLEELFVEFENHYNILKAHLEWCEAKRFVPFISRFEECKEENFNGLGLSIYINSSFVPPINYFTVETEVEELNKQKEKLKNMHEALVTFRKEHNEALEQINNAKLDIKDVQSQLKHSERRSIEILSIFSAIVVFAIGNIKLFENVKDFGQALLFMLTFTFSLTTFVGLIVFVTRFNSVQITKSQKVFLGLVSCSMLVFSVVLWFYEFIRLLQFKFTNWLYGILF